MNIDIVYGDGYKESFYEVKKVRFSPDSVEVIDSVKHISPAIPCSSIKKLDIYGVDDE